MCWLVRSPLYCNQRLCNKYPSIYHQPHQWFFGYLSAIPLIGYSFTFIHKFTQEILFAYHAPFFRAHGILLMVFVLLIAAGIVFRRYWCRNICPMGAILALFSEWTVFKRAVSSSCTSCGLCVENCGMGAIESDGYGTKAGECILCMTCQKVCRKTALPLGQNNLQGRDMR